MTFEEFVQYVLTAYEVSSSYQLETNHCKYIYDPPPQTHTQDGNVHKSNSISPILYQKPLTIVLTMHYPLARL